MQTNVEDDFAAVHALKAQYKLTPLAAWVATFRPAADLKVAPVDQGRTTRPAPEGGEVKSIR
jgi:hypothetical protein